MNKKDQEYAVIKSAINVLCIMCCAPPDLVIDALIGILWDKEEAVCIKRSSGKFEI